MANALLLGGGAPTLTLQAGALAALHDKQVRFDVVSTAGAGMLVGLLFVASEGTLPGQALESTKEMGVHDDIYGLFPVNLKCSTDRASWRSLSPLAAVAAPHGARSGPRQPAVRRLDGVVDRRLVPVRSLGAQPWAVQPCAVDRRGCRLRQA